MFHTTLAHIPCDAGIAIEYNIPQTSKRIDFLISGYDETNQSNVVIIELKQWDRLTAVSGADGLVETYTGNAIRQVVHPSYQAWSYAMLITDYNQAVQEGNIGLCPCAYLHNYRRTINDPLDEMQYKIYLEDAPAFTRGQVQESLKGIKSMYRENPKKALEVADEIIKNTYQTLMTRGMKGCYVYCVDEGLANYLRDCLKSRKGEGVN